MAVAVRTTFMLVGSGALAIAGYGFFVLRGGGADPRLAPYARRIEHLTDQIAMACAEGRAPGALEADALGPHVAFAEGECGLETDPGSGLATTTIPVASVGSPLEDEPLWRGDPSSLHCAGERTMTCTALLAHPTLHDRARIVRVRRFVNGWARVEVTLDLD